MLSILCILDDVPEIMLGYCRQIKLDSLTSLYKRVTDQDFISDITMKVKFLADNLLQKIKNKANLKESFEEAKPGEGQGLGALAGEALSKIVNMQSDSFEYVKEIDQRFSKEEQKVIVSIFKETK